MLTLSGREPLKWVPWQTVETQMKCRIMFAKTKSIFRESFGNYHIWPLNIYNGHPERKICLKQPLKRRPKVGFQDRLMLNADLKYCRMLQESILQYFRPSLRYHLSLRSLFMPPLFVECGRALSVAHVRPSVCPSVHPSVRPSFR